MKLHKTLLLHLILLSFLFPMICNGEETEVNQRKKIISALQAPRIITRLDWMFLRWELILNDGAMKKVLLDPFEEKENCQFGTIRLDENNNAIRVPILCTDDILKKTKQKRLDIIEERALGYLMLFNSMVWSGLSVDKFSEETFNGLKKIFSFDAEAIIKDQKGDIVDLIKIGSYEFGEKKLPKKEEKFSSNSMGSDLHYSRLSYIEEAAAAGRSLSSLSIDEMEGLSRVKRV